MPSLICHPATPTDIVQTLDVEIAHAGGVLALRYVLAAQMARLQVPPLRPAARRDELWKHTCFEAFLAERAGGAYRELNFSPSSEWATYAFEHYRHGMSVPEAPAPEIRVQLEASRLTLDVRVRAGIFSQVALAAVIEDGNGRLSYWALRHPPGKPDFHHPESFTELP